MDAETNNLPSDQAREQKPTAAAAAAAYDTADRDSQKLEALRRYAAEKVVADRLRSRAASCGGPFAWFCLTLGALIFFYQLVSLRDVYLDHFSDYSARKEFVSISGLERFPFLSEIVHQSKRIVDKGMYLPVFARWVEQTYLYKLITLDNWSTRAGLFVLILASLYLTCQYFMNVHYIDRLAPSVSRRNQLIAKITSDPMSAFVEAAVKSHRPSGSDAPSDE